MKNKIAALAVLIISALGAQAKPLPPLPVTTDLRSTPAQLAARYGKPDKVERSWIGWPAYGFKLPGNTYLYAILAPDGTAGDLVFTRWDAKGKDIPFTEKEMKALIFRNFDPHIAYANDRGQFGRGWDGIAFEKRLGNEYNVQTLLEPNYNPTHAVFGSLLSLPGHPAAAHIRTAQQFWLEQPAVKQLINAKKQ